MEIDKNNFAENFFDIRDHEPREGDCLARFRGIAELLNGFEKKQMIQMLGEPNTHLAICQIMRKLCRSRDPDTFRVPQQMGADLLEGMTEEEVLEKPYEFEIELFYYTKPENVPINNHWSIIHLMNMEDYLKATHSSEEKEKE
jgi:hypothetical protein